MPSYPSHACPHTGTNVDHFPPLWWPRAGSNPRYSHCPHWYACRWLREGSMGRGTSSKLQRLPRAGMPVYVHLQCWWVSPVGLMRCPRPRSHSRRLCHTATHDMSPQASAAQVCKDTEEGRVPAYMPMCATGLAKTACRGVAATAEQHPLLLPQLLTSLCRPSTCRSRRGSLVQL